MERGLNHNDKCEIRSGQFNCSKPVPVMEMEDMVDCSDVLEVESLCHPEQNTQYLPSFSVWWSG